MIGEFRREYSAKHGPQRLAKLRVHTKFVPDLSTLAHIDRKLVEQTIDRSLKRLDVERLDLVQFHWWNYNVPRDLETAYWLKELQQAGKIGQLGGTNFDTAHSRELIKSVVPLLSMQSQRSPAATGTRQA